VKNTLRRPCIARSVRDLSAQKSSKGSSCSMAARNTMQNMPHWPSSLCWARGHHRSAGRGAPGLAIPAAVCLMILRMDGGISCNPPGVPIES